MKAYIASQLLRYCGVALLLIAMWWLGMAVLVIVAQSP
jgi:hypothetical protein